VKRGENSFVPSIIKLKLIAFFVVPQPNEFYVLSVGNDVTW